jgi:hypothetical protein
MTDLVDRLENFRKRSGQAGGASGSISWILPFETEYSGCRRPGSATSPRPMLGA